MRGAGGWMTSHAEEVACNAGCRIQSEGAGGVEVVEPTRYVAMKRKASVFVVCLDRSPSGTAWDEHFHL